METLATWEKILLGVIAVGILVLFWPGAKRSMETSPKGSRADWKNLAVILAIVVLFVFLLVASV